MLYDGTDLWKKKGHSEFNIQMGSWDGAESTDVVGLFLLDKLSKIKVNGYTINVGIYRDDCLLVTRLTPRLTQKLTEKLKEIFDEYDLAIITDANHKKINFLDIHMDLERGIYSSYMKPNNTIKYVHTKSNHPPSILKNNPENINKRISRNSENEEEFKKVVKPYQEALDTSKYNYKLKFDENARNVIPRNKRNRNRRITWFNPPFALNVKTNVGKMFLQIIHECFPSHHKLYKICNKNTLKMSYRTTSNMKSYVSSHNRKILQQYRDQQHQEPENKIHCNCQARLKPECAMPDKCTITNLVYRAKLTRPDNNTKHTQTGSTVQFKQRYRAHKDSFSDPDKHQTSLSQYIWKHLKPNNITYDIEWDVVERASPYNPSTGMCLLCVKEKYNIMKHPEGASLNQRNDFFSPCYHKEPQLIKNFNFNPKLSFKRKNKYFSYPFNY